MSQKTSPLENSFVSIKKRSSKYAGICGWIVLAGLTHAEEKAVSLSRFNYPFDTGRLIYAYPAVTVESSAWSSSFAAAPAPRSMPTAVSVQSSVWSSSFAAPPEPRSEAAVPPPEREPTPRKKAVKPAVVRKNVEREAPEPAPEPEAPAPAHKKAPHPNTEPENAAAEPRPKFRAKPQLREKPEQTAEAAKEVVEKEVLQPTPETSLVNISGTAGYYSHYMFRGLDVGYRTGIDQSNSSAFFGTSGAVAIENFAVGFWYMNSLDSYVPGGAGFDGSFGNPNKQLAFKTPPRVRYQEYDLFANYTFRLTKDLSLAAGMNFYWFSDGRFWAQGDHHVNNTMEGATTLNWTGIPYLNQTLGYYYDFDAFKGGYMEYKVSMRPIELYKNGDFAIGLSPNLSLSYDFRYNGTNNGWNNFEPGIDVPIHITDGLSLNFGARYSMDLGDSSSGPHGKAVDRTDDRLWFSATFQYTFPTAESSAKALARREGKNLVADMAFGDSEENTRWRVTAGAGMRSIHSSFDVGRAKPYNVDSLFSRKAGGGDLGFATDNRTVTYLDGTVFSGNSAGYNDGTTNFTVQNASQVTNLDGGNRTNRQITYHSERYNYSKDSEGQGFHQSDDDQIVYPYISLSYDAIKQDRFSASVGLGYAFNHASMNSGTQLAGLQSLNEQHAAHQFTYDLDEIFSTKGRIPTPLINNTPGPSNYYLIYDGRQYSATYSPFAVAFVGLPVPVYNPQHTEVDTKQMVVQVAAFRAATLDMDMHSASLPIDFNFEVTPRVQARLSVGPTFNLFNEDLKTDTYYQLLDAGVMRITKNNSERVINGAPPISLTGTGGGTVVGTIPGTRGGNVSSAGGNSSTVSSMTSFQAASSAGGGKGSSGGQSRSLPGQSLARVSNHDNSQHFECGVFGQFAVDVDLDAAKRWFLEAYARYDYVPTFSVSDGAASSLIDASSWGAGIGLGLRF